MQHIYVLNDVLMQHIDSFELNNFLSVDKLIHVHAWTNPFGTTDVKMRKKKETYNNFKSN